jgi:DNA polymerase-3 subunit gamma/tau
MLTKDASNALLKTLEEPPSNTIFILATTDAHKMIPTILSRVQKFDFKPLAHSELKQKILFIAKEEKVKIDEQVVNQIILQAMGGARDAESILGKLISAGTEDITVDFASAILGKNSYFEAYTLLEFLSQNQIYLAIRHIHKLYASGYGIEQLIVNLLTISHNIFLLQIENSLIQKESLLDDEYSKLESLALTISKVKIRNFIQSLEIIKSQTHTAYLPYLPLELVIAQIWEIDNMNNNEKNIISDNIDNTIITKSDINLAPKTQPIDNTPPQNIPPSPKIQPVKDTSIVKEMSGFADIYSVYKIYPAINKALTKTNKSLAIIFAQTQPVEIIDNIITIAVDSDFYRSRLDKNTKLILEYITEHYPSILGINFVTKKVSSINTMNIEPNNDFNAEDDEKPKDINDTIADIFKDSL